MTVDHVTADSVAIATDTNIVDTPTLSTANTSYAVNVSISDIEAPQLLAALTMDKDGNGLIDHIKLMFNEAVNDTNLAGYVDVDEIATGAAPYWTVDGYTVIGLNFTQTDSIAALAGTALGDSVINVSDVAEDEILYLMVAESGAVNGDTGVEPDIGMTGGVDASSLSDFTPTYTADIDAFESTDGAAPRMLSAVMVSETNLQLRLSEAAEDEDDIDLAKNIFVWMVGNQEADISEDVLEFTQPSAGLLQLVITPGSAIPPGVASTIAFKDYGVMDDANGVANADSADVTIDITPYSPEGVVFGPAITVLFPNGGDIIDGVTGYSVPIMWSSANFTDAEATAILSYQADGGTWTTIVDEDADAAVTAAAAALDAANTALADADSVVAALEDSLAAATTAADSLLIQADLDDAEDVQLAAAADVVAATTAYDAAVADAAILVSAGTYTWSPGDDLVGMNVSVKVTSGSASDMSNNTFKIQGATDITGQSITVLYPNGGEEINVGSDSSINILWDASGFDADEPAIVKYMADGGSWMTMVDVDADEAILDAAAAVDAAEEEVTALEDSLAGATTAADSTAIQALLDAAMDVLDAADDALIVAQADSVILISDMALVWKDIDVSGNVRIKVSAGDVSDMSDLSFMVNAVTDTIAPPRELRIDDVPGDNGYLVLARIRAETRAANNIGWDQIKSFQFYRRTKKAGVSYGPWGYVMSVPANIIPTSGYYYVYVFSPSNQVLPWGVVASTEEVSSTVVSYGKIGDIPVGVVDEALAKAAISPVTLSNIELCTASGGSVDNIAPSPFTGFEVIDNTDVGTGMKVTWSAPDDHGFLGMLGAQFGLGGGTPIFGVEKYEIYRKLETDAEFGMPIGFVGPGVFQFIDDTIEDNTVGYTYQVKAVDGNPDHYVVTEPIDTLVEDIPEVFALSKNFPNPFNPTTTIEYQIPTAGNVELVIFNMAGQVVRTLINESKDAGYYKVMWNGRNDMGETVASGLYFYKLVSGNFNKIEKMTLIK